MTGTAVETPRPRRIPVGSRVSRRTLATMLLCFVVCAGRSLQVWSQLHLGGFDIGIFDQGIRAYAHLHLPVSEMKNVHHNFPPGYSLLGDHFSPILALLAPLYWIWDDPRVLLLAQAALFAAGVPLVRRIARRSFAHLRLAIPSERLVDVVGLVYATGWPLMSAAGAGFHEVSFAVPFTLLLLDAAATRRYRLAGLAAVLLCLCKEDLGLIVGVFGVVLLLRSLRAGDRAGKVTGVAMLVLGPVVSAIQIEVLLPAMGGVRGYYWDYDRLGPDPVGVVTNVLGHPWLLVTAATDQGVKLQLIGWIVASLALLPLGSLTSLCWLPLLAERLYSTNPNHWTVTNQYDAFLWPFLLVAAIETFARIAPRLSTARLRALGGLTLVTALLTSSALGLFGWMWPPDLQASPTAQALIDAANRIPAGASVEATNNVAPRLLSDHYVVIADEVPRCLDYVLLPSEPILTFGFLTPEGPVTRARMLERHGYVVVSDEGGAILLRKTPRADVPGCHLPGPNSVPVREEVPPGQRLPLFSGAFHG
ncbi:DUF2079 domain-containing protein [Nocardioides maradonensis]